MRIRTIKPEFWKSLTIATLPLSARLTFIGLWNYADDEGRGIYDARLLAADIWPLDEDRTPSAVESDVAAIEVAGLVSRYDSGGRTYFQVRSWAEHQTIPKAKPSRFPPPSGTPTGRVPEPYRPEGNREQGTGKGKDSPSAFAEFWQAYPRKVAKKAAVQKFAKAVADGADPAVIVAAAQRYADDPERDARYTAHPATWLHQGRWEDETPIPPRLVSVDDDSLEARVARGRALGVR